MHRFTRQPHAIHLSARQQKRDVARHNLDARLDARSLDNLAEGATGNAVWVEMANAIHQGISGVRGPSDLIKATAGTGKDAPKEITLTFTGGTDGAEKIDGAA